ncbi:MAG: filamentous hemagglutinin N-terminal domain-containing protein [Cyanobacteria bacterium P01_F01_bin.150]
MNDFFWTVNQNGFQSQRRYHQSTQTIKKRLFFKLLLSMVGITTLAQPGLANTIVPNGLNTAIDDQACANSCTVTDGSTRGTNLFHSFEEFSVPVNSTVTFQHDGAIANIITRVTGGSTSRINGTIQTLLDGSTDDVGTADFFLINPSGIVFGVNAQLNTGGSFIASTAERLTFEDGTEFDINEANPLLTISVPAGLQVGTNPGPIKVTGAGNELFLNTDSTVNRSDRPVGISAPTGNTLALIGGNITVNGGNLTAESGHIELGSLGNDQHISLNQTNTGWTIDYLEVNAFGNIQFINASSADVTGDDAGTLHLQGRNITLQDGSSLLANTLVEGGGEITIQVAEEMQMDGVSATAPPDELFSPMPTSVYIEISSGAVGDGSSLLSVDGQQLTFTNGAQMGLSMAGSGTSGRVAVNAETINVNGDSPTSFSGFFAAVLPVFGESSATGSGGDVQVETNQLSLTGGGQILASTFGVGSAGNLEINAETIEIIGFNQGPSGLQAASELPPSGGGGSIIIDTSQLLVADGGQIATSTESFTAPAGDLKIRATESIELRGTAPFSRSGLFASATSFQDFETGNVFEGFGEGGNIELDVGTLIVDDEATINISNNPSNPLSPISDPGNGPAGNLSINADFILLNNQAVVMADTVDGDRANIDLKADLIAFLNESQITTNATGTATGGNLTIAANTLVGIENSDITANAVDNFGGRVVITANGIFGTEFRQQITPESDITATSALGPQFSGIVVLNTPDVDPSRSTAALPTGFLDPDAQVTTACEKNEGNRLVLIGRGGLPPNASQELTGQTIWQDLRWADTQTATVNNPIFKNPPSFSAYDQSSFFEAQRWEMAPNGQVNLVTQAPILSMMANHHHIGCQ